MYSYTEENYLKTIYQLSEGSKGYVFTNDISGKISTTAASVTDMLKKLSVKKLIRYRRYNGVALTENGKKIAINIIRKHRLWEMFLVSVLDFKWDEVHDVAEQLEHIRSEKLIQHIDKLLNHPRFDPHGDPIPDANGKLFPHKSLFLSDVKNKSKVIVTGVADHSKEFLRYLDNAGIMIGSKIKIEEIQLYDKSLFVFINEKKRMYLSRKVAKNILIIHDDNGKKTRKKRAGKKIA